MRELIINALKSKLVGQMNSHIANIEVMVNNPVGVGDHPTIVDTVEKELGALEHANGKLNVLVKYLERRLEDDKKETVSKPKR